MTTVTHDTRLAAGPSPRLAAGGGLGFALRLRHRVRAVRRAGARAARRRLDAGRGRAGPGRGRRAGWSSRSASSRCAAGGTCCAATPALVTAYGVRGGGRLRSSAYFAAVSHMQVGPALLIEYTAPAAVVVLALAAARPAARARDARRRGAGRRSGWCWSSTCSRAPTSTRSACCGRCGAMVGLRGYFVISADEGNGLPPLDAGGRRAGASARPLLGAAGLVGVLPMHASGDAVDVRRRRRSPWWLPLLALGVVTAALSTSPASRPAAGSARGWRRSWRCSRCSPRVVFAWLLLGELPRARPARSAAR